MILHRHWCSQVTVLLFFLGTVPLSAQMQAVQTGGGPRLVGKHNGKATPVTLTELFIKTKVSGLLAETTLTCTFHNDADRLMEGEFLLPLPDSATVSGYALDVNGQMVDGVIVEKHKARFVFEREQRKKVDPGTVEWIDGKVFRTRVYPVPANGARTVRISYVHPLYAFGGRLHYRLPFEGYPSLNRLKLDLSFDDMPAVPQLARDPFGELRLKKYKAGFRLKARFSEVQPEKELVVSCAYPDRDLVNITPLENNEYAFLAAVRVDQTAVARSGWRQERMALYWDGSASMTDVGRTRAVVFLKAFLRRYHGVKQIDLVVFRDRQEAPRRFQRQDGSFSALFAFLQNIPVDGGTNVYGLTPPSDADFAMLVSDGRDVTNGVGWPRFDMPLFAVQPEPLGTDQILRPLAKESFGDYLDLSRTKTEAAVDQVGRSLPMLLHAADPEGRLIDVFASGEHSLADRLWVCGRFKGSAPLTLDLDFGLGSETERRYELAMDPLTAASPFAARYWAQSKLREYLVRPDQHHDAVMALARRYNLVTPKTTLMVLETFEQYLEYRIPPPENLKTWRTRYFKQMEPATDAENTIVQYRKTLLTDLNKVPAFMDDVAPLTDFNRTRSKNRSRWDSVMSSRFSSYQHGGAFGEDGVVIEQGSGPKPLVEGVLLNASGYPVGQASLVLTGTDPHGETQRFETTTDQDGFYRFSTVTDGTYRVEMAASGCVPFTSEPFSVEGNRRVWLLKRLASQSPQATVAGGSETWRYVETAESEGVVRDQNGAALPGAVIVLESEDGTLTRSVVSDADGHFSIKHMPPGRHRMKAVFPGYLFDTVTATPGRENQSWLQVSLVADPESEAVVVVADQTIERDITPVSADLPTPQVPSEGEISTAVAPWDKSAPYLQDLEKAEADQRYRRYLELRPQYQKSPSFYLDVARFFFKRKQPLLGRRILTNILEMGMDDAALNRVTAFVLTEFGQYDAALALYDKLADQRPEWPQVRRERGLLLAEKARQALSQNQQEAAQALFGEALHDVGDALWQPWGDLPDYLAPQFLNDRRFQHFREIAAVDYRLLFQEINHHLGAKRAAAMAFPALNGALGEDLQGDAMVTVVWDDPTADINLWVVEPTLEPCFWRNRRTRLGGFLFADLTAGLGPEGYFLRNAAAGTYQVCVRYWGSDGDQLAGPTTCVVTVITDVGRPNETRRHQTVRLDKAREGTFITTFTIP